MDENTITAPDENQEAGASVALPADESDQNAAATAPIEQTTDDGGAEASVPDVDEKLVSFAKGQGIEDVGSLTKREQSLLKMAYDNQAEYQRTNQKASELEKSLAADTPPAPVNGTDVEVLAAEVRSLKMAQNVNSFFTGNPEAKAYEEQMTAIVSDPDRPEMRELVNAGYLSIEDLYAMARGKDTSRETNLKTEGGREALEKVAAKQQARAVVGSATNSDMSAPDDSLF